MNPRTKEGQGLDFWAKELLENKSITPGEWAEFIVKNSLKEQRMTELKLPQLQHFGFFESVEAIKERVKPQEGQRFIIRCGSKKDGGIQRLLNATFDEVCAFAEKLPGGFDAWNVEVKEFAATKAAGTIIIAPSGRTIIETWQGEHYLNTTDCPKWAAEYDPERFDLSFKWTMPKEVREGTQQDDTEIKHYAIEALKFFFPHVKPKPHEPMYVEYGVKENGEIYFIEANDSSVLTGK